MRQSTFAALRRVAPDTYELSADIDVTLSLPGTALAISTDRQAWRPLASTRVADNVRATVTRGALRRDGRAYLRAAR